MKKRKKRSSAAMLMGRGACPCHSGSPYARCCKPYHTGQMHAPTPRVLMRSRYAAYARGLSGYIMETTCPQGPRHQLDAAKWEAEIEEFSRTTSFHALEIIDDMEDGDRGEVLFLATLVQGGEAHQMREHSLFRRTEEGAWRYVGLVQGEDA